MYIGVPDSPPTISILRLRALYRLQRVYIGTASHVQADQEVWTSNIVS